MEERIVKTVARWLGLALAALVLSTAASAAQLIKIVTTSPGVPWNILGAKVAAELNKRLPDVSASAGTGGSTANISDVAQGNAKLGWTVNSTALEAYTGTGAFKGRAVKDFQVLGAFAATPLQLIARKGSGIARVEDLLGKRVAVGQASWGTTQLSLKVLAKFGITPTSMKEKGGLLVFTGYDAWQAQMQDGIVDAVVYWGGIPSSLTIGLINEPGIEFVPFREQQVAAVLADPAFKEILFPMTIKAGTYEPLKSDYKSFTYASIAIANPQLDEKIAYETLKVIYEGGPDTKVYKDGLSQTLDLAKVWLPSNTLPLHPGAQKYFREKGLIH
jgi:TRAP transporter TAXI family solute receptor